MLPDAPAPAAAPPVAAPAGAPASPAPTPPVDPNAAPAPAAAPPGPKDGAALAAIRAREARLVADRREFARQQEQYRREREEWQRQQTVLLDSLKPKAEPPPVDQRLSDYERRVAVIEEENGRLKQFAQQTAAQRQKDFMDREVSLFRTEAEKSADHPLAAALAKRNPSRLTARALQIAQEEARGGVALTNPEILGRIEDELAEYASLRSPPASSEAPQAAPSAPQTPATHSPPGKSATPAAPTLTTQTASQRASDGTTPKSIIDMTPAEQHAAAIEAIRAARAKRAQANGKPS